MVCIFTGIVQNGTVRMAACGQKRKQRSHLSTQSKLVLGKGHKLSKSFASDTLPPAAPNSAGNEIFTY